MARYQHDGDDNYSNASRFGLGVVRETTGVYLFVLQKLVFSLARLRAASVGGKEKVRQVSNWIFNALPTVQDTAGTKGESGCGGGWGWGGVRGGGGNVFQYDQSSNTSNCFLGAALCTCVKA